MSADRFPLVWPVGIPRAKRREHGRFRTTFARARDALVDELRSLGAAGLILSTNVPLRHDGLPYAGVREPDDPGVAVYFQLKGKPHTMTCDRWKSVAGNLQALALTVEAMRGIARWGSAEMRDQAFAGFQALPPSAMDWRSVFRIADRERVDLELVKSVYRGLALKYHPDRGGDVVVMQRLNEAMAAAEKELGGLR